MKKHVLRMTTDIFVTEIIPGIIWILWGVLEWVKSDVSNWLSLLVSMVAIVATIIPLCCRREVYDELTMKNVREAEAVALEVVIILCMLFTCVQLVCKLFKVEINCSFAQGATFLVGLSRMTVGIERLLLEKHGDDEWQD